MSGKYDDLEKLRDLYSKGIITEAEFNAEKAKILNDNREAGVNETTQTADNNNGYCSLMHLSQFSNFLFPGLGLIIPIVMWATRKNESKFADVNGKIIFNWKISSFIYTSVLVILVIAAALVFGTQIAFSGIGNYDTFQGMMDDNPMKIFSLIGALGIIIIPAIAIVVLDFIFTIIGAIKANKGEVWNYPLSIRFFSTKNQ
ncbi:MAG: DUF4870 domain-containing protein [Bacteroidia bacterium]|nr:DUF4870 domain-containing protein [Bacteroidia bacterium]HRG03412.1 DUF4870 domain-containing protein [Paludibacteraceae bacterium]